MTHIRVSLDRDGPRPIESAFRVLVSSQANAEHIGESPEQFHTLPGVSYYGLVTRNSPYALTRQVAMGELLLPCGRKAVVYARAKSLRLSIGVGAELYGKPGPNAKRYMTKEEYEFFTAEVLATRILDGKLVRPPAVSKSVKSLSRQVWRSGLVDMLLVFFGFYAKGLHATQQHLIALAALQGVFESFAAYTPELGQRFSDYTTDPALAFLSYAAKTMSRYAHLEAVNLRGENEGDVVRAQLTIKQKYSGSWIEFRTLAYCYRLAKRQLESERVYTEPTLEDILQAGNQIQAKLENAIPVRFRAQTQSKEAWHAWLYNTLTRGLEIESQDFGGYEVVPSDVLINDLCACGDVSHYMGRWSGGLGTSDLQMHTRAGKISRVVPGRSVIDLETYENLEILERIREEVLDDLARVRGLDSPSLTPRMARIIDALYFSALPLVNNDYLEARGDIAKWGYELAKVKGLLAPVVREGKVITALENTAYDTMDDMRVKGESETEIVAFEYRMENKVSKLRKRLELIKLSYALALPRVSCPDVQRLSDATPGMAHGLSLPVTSEGKFYLSKIKKLSRTYRRRLVNSKIHRVAYHVAFHEALISDRYEAHDGVRIYDKIFNRYVDLYSIVKDEQFINALREVQRVIKIVNERKYFDLDKSRLLTIIDMRDLVNPKSAAAKVSPQAYVRSLLEYRYGLHLVERKETTGRCSARLVVVGNQTTTSTQAYARALEDLRVQVAALSYAKEIALCGDIHPFFKHLTTQQRLGVMQILQESQIYKDTLARVSYLEIRPVIRYVFGNTTEQHIKYEVKCKRSSSASLAYVHDNQQETTYLQPYVVEAKLLPVMEASKKPRNGKHSVSPIITDMEGLSETL